MLRRGSLQRGFVTLLMLLCATPQMLLRPCCCSQTPANQDVASQADKLLGQNQNLPPCCLKRLQAARTAPSAKIHSANSRPGMSESGRCCCRIGIQMARTGRVIINESLLRPLLAGFSNVIDTANQQPVLARSMTTAVHSAWPDSGIEHCARLCRWLV